jgi:hypothetical protein
MGDADRAPRLSRVIEERMAGDPRLVEGLMRVLNHELAPSKVFTPRLGLTALARAMRAGRGQRRALLGEARELAVDEVRHRGPPRIKGA